MGTISQKYRMEPVEIDTLLTWAKTDDLAIPEIQRPFVWKKKQVTDLMDSLYRGYPIGVMIAWKNPKINLKNGKISEGKKMLIDGQQRVAALRTAILGEKLVNDEYKKERIQVSFHPITEKFSTLTAAIKRDPAWIKDIGPIVNGTERIFEIKKIYCKQNPKVNEKDVEDHLDNLRQISLRRVGFIELSSDLDLEIVNDIFQRVNSYGTELSISDFVMSRIAIYGKFGTNLRKTIDYFCHLFRYPEIFSDIKQNDTDFSKTTYFSKIEWLKNENEELYVPKFTNVLRVAFTSEFNRAKMSDLVKLLSGRNLTTKKEFDESEQIKSFKKLENGILRFVNKSNFKRFLIILRTAGFIDNSLASSKGPLDFAYILFLKLRDLKIESSKIESYVRRWYVMSVLTGRYAGSPEPMFDQDVKKITKKFYEQLKYEESTELSSAFWNVQLVSELENSNTNSPLLKVFFASQVKNNDNAFLSTDAKVSDLLAQAGDIHHIFPKNYLKKKFNDKKTYNQIANLAYTETPINLAINDKPPSQYFGDLKNQCKKGKITTKYGGITSMSRLKKNMSQNCISESIFTMEIDDYFEFLNQRRVLMAKKIKEYYQSL